MGEEDSTLTSLSRYLRSSSNVNPLEKMLTPVEERPAEGEDDQNPFSDEDDDDDIENDTHIVSSTSHKIDGGGVRPGSGLSSSGGGTSWMMGSEVSSVKSSVSILSGGDGDGEGHYLEKGKVMILRSQNSGSQVIDKDSTLTSAEPPLHPLLDGPSSTAEERSSQRTADALNSRHEAFAEPSSRLLFQHKRYSLRDNHSGAQRSSPLSSTSQITSRLSSSADESDHKIRKYSLSERYARYEAFRSPEVPILADNVSKESEFEPNSEPKETVVYSQNSTQDSVDTIIADTVSLEGEVGCDKHASSESCSGGVGQDSDGKGGKEEELHGPPSTRETSDGSSNGSGIVLPDKRLMDIKDSLKHCDSGIDDTPEANKTFKEGIRRLSMPPADQDTPMSDTKPLTHTLAFASRESGLADSPDPELLADELKVLRLPPGQHSSEETSPQQQQQMGGRRERTPLSSTFSDVEISVALDGSDVLSPDTEKSDFSTEEDCDGIQAQFRDERFSSSFERPNVVPRSLEHSSFSRYARTPIRDSRLLKASDVPPLQDGTGLRYRSVSMDKITSYERSPEPRSAETRSMSTSKSAMLGPQSPIRNPMVTKNMHPSQRFCVHLDEGDPPSLLTDELHSSPADSPTSSFREKRVKKNRGLKERLKPALRVLKISPNNTSAISPSPILDNPPLEEEDEQPDSPSHSHSASSTPKDDFRGAMRRVRMVSPEAVATHFAPAKNVLLKRSHSSEDILDSSSEVKDELETSTKVGSLVVIPEPKYKSRGKLFGKMRGRKGGKGGSPVVMTKYSVSLGALASSTSSSSFSSFEGGDYKSPKNKKRHTRTPHFV